MLACDDYGFMTGPMRVCERDDGEERRWDGKCTVLYCIVP